MHDGVDGTMVLLNFLKNIPTEVLEREMPEVLIHHYGLRPDSGGAGRYRGGTGIEIDFETRAPYTTVTSRSMERYIFGPPGRLGGHAGATGYTLFKPRRADARDIGKIDLLDMDVGDRLRIGTQGGGGFGRPFDRPEADVFGGRPQRSRLARRTPPISMASSSRRRERSTREATEKRRAELRRAAGEPPQFGFDAARLDHYRRWPDAVYDAIDAETRDLAPILRQLIYYEVQRRIETRWQDGTAVAAADVPALIADVQHEYGVG